MSATETVHASTVAIQGRAVLLTGASGAGKSDLALRLIDRGFTLVSDDQTVLTNNGDQLVASAPANIAGMLEVRGIGIVPAETTENVPVALIVELTSDVPRLPEDGRKRQFLGVGVPLISVDPMTASAASKVALGLDRLGLSF